MTGLTHLLHRTIAGKYRIEQMIGRGGGAAVFLARHTEMDRTVAIKLLYPQKNTESTRQRFAQEARLISQFNHPNTITVFDYGQHEQHMYLVMEFIEGGSLEEYIKKHGAQSAKRAVEMTLGILGSLEEAHHHGVLHRDLKPENIMLTQNFKGEWIPKVVDFGIAKVLHSGDNAPEGGVLTQENSFVGTPRYTAPEQILSDDIGPASDLYNVGLIMWYMLTGKSPIASKKVKECLRAHLSKTPWILPEDAHVPENLAAIVHRALLKDRRQRYSSCGEMIEELEHWLKHPTAQSTATLEMTKAVIQELVVDDDDDWMFDQSHIIDPNVMHTSEILGVSGNSFDLSSTFNANDTASSGVRSAVQYKTDRQQIVEMSKPIIETPTTLAEALFDDPPEHAPTQPKPSQPAPAATIAQPRPQPQASQSQLMTAPSIPKSGTPRSFVIAMVSLIAVVIVVAVVSLIATQKRQSQPTETPVADDTSASAKQTNAPEADTSKPEKIKPSGRFRPEGLALVMRSQQWKLITRGEPQNLSSFSKQSYLFSKKKAKVEMAILTTKNQSVLSELVKQTDRAAKPLVFDTLLVRLMPLNDEAKQALPGLERTFERYRTMVVNHNKPPAP